MATYALDYYGLTKYGQRRVVDYSVQPFVVTQTDYEHLAISWTLPVADWERLRLVRSVAGYPAGPGDGQVIIDATPDEPQTATSDTTITPGGYQYYAIFVLDPVDKRWQRAGGASVLVVADKDSHNWLLERVPIWHRYLGGELTTLLTQPENEDLKKFLAMFAAGVDHLRSMHEPLLRLNDIGFTHHRNLINAALQLGCYADPRDSATLLRRRLMAYSHVIREKGTVEGLRHWIRIMTGWDISVRVTGNLMLTMDESSFVHPQYEMWSPLVYYPKGTRVQHDQGVGAWYEAKRDAYGCADIPDPTKDTDAWKRLGDTLAADPTVRNKLTGGPFTWEVIVVGVSKDTGDWWEVQYSPQGPGSTAATRPDLGGFETANLLNVRNKDTASRSVVLKSVSRRFKDPAAPASGREPSLDPMQVIADGVPLPRATQPWLPSREYQVGELVEWNRRVYQAVRRSQGVIPDRAGSTSWWTQASRADDRLAITIAGYLRHATGGALPVKVGVAWFDEHGEPIGMPANATWTPAAASTALFDSFTSDSPATGRRPVEVGAATWKDVKGAFTTTMGALPPGSVIPSGGVWHPVDMGAPSVSVVDTGLNGAENLRVAATIRTTNPSADTAAPQAIVARYDTTNNSHIRATRTALEQVAADGKVTQLGTYGGKVVRDGDRLMVELTGSTTATVYINGTKVLTVPGVTLNPKNGNVGVSYR
ncbi:hypothetical protein [Actinomadura atramentaria]|uniref:hypothetical protein n=1 Tax=Actinomadura atramentaria TaxID=1990 RepID=UPI00037E5162|nr:hypothetical protein [Actinomadura atramentaria]